MYSIETKSLVKSFGDVVAVNDVSFSVESGEIFGFLGDTLQIPADDPFVGHLIINVMKLEKLE